MKNTMKKIGALAMALAMLLALSTTAFAVPAELANGEVGGYTTADTPVVQEDSVNIKKEILAYNANTHAVNAPVATYTYTVTPASVSGLTVTDATTDHASGTAVTVPVQAGITTGLVVTGTAAGSAGDASSAVGTLVFTNASTFNAGSAGVSNVYDINLDFSGVTFTQPGVYRYQIAETLSDTYAHLALEDGGENARYLDVYVDGGGNIYGYVCMAANNSVTPATTKTNGFVDAGAGADKYYTYDLTLSKDVVNDTYGENNIAFPFTVIFNNTAGYTSTFTIAETAGTGSTGISPAAASAPTWSGVARVKDGGAITYTGIPAGVDVDVYETNIATGVTYTVATAVNGGAATTDNNVSWGGVPASAVAQTTRAAYESTKATVDTTANTAVAATQTIAITNTLLLISPTGVALRVAPFAMMLAAGIFLLLVSKKYRREEA